MFKQIAAVVLTLLVILLGQPAQADPATLWYNGDGDGINSYVNQNNAQFNQVLYNDFNVTGGIWHINTVWSNNIFLNGLPQQPTTASWEIRSGFDPNNSAAGALIASGDSIATLTPTGNAAVSTSLGFDEYQVLVAGLNITLNPGVYWLAVYPDDTNLSQAGNDTTSGLNAVGTPPGNNLNGFYSTDSGANFLPSALDTSAGIGGFVDAAVPEPASLATWGGIGIVGLVAGWRRKRSRPATA